MLHRSPDARWAGQWLVIDLQSAHLLLQWTFSCLANSESSKEQQSHKERASGKKFIHSAKCAGISAEARGKWWKTTAAYPALRRSKLGIPQFWFTMLSQDSYNLGQKYSGRVQFWCPRLGNPHDSSGQRDFNVTWSPSTRPVILRKCTALQNQQLQQKLTETSTFRIWQKEGREKLREHVSSTSVGIPATALLIPFDPKQTRTVVPSASMRTSAGDECHGTWRAVATSSCIVRSHAPRDAGDTGQGRVTPGWESWGTRWPGDRHDTGKDSFRWDSSLWTAWKWCFKSPVCSCILLLPTARFSKRLSTFFLALHGFHFGGVILYITAIAAIALIPSSSSSQPHPGSRHHHLLLHPCRHNHEHDEHDFLLSVTDIGFFGDGIPTARAQNYWHHDEHDPHHCLCILFGIICINYMPYVQEKCVRHSALFLSSPLSQLDTYLFLPHLLWNDPKGQLVEKMKVSAGTICSKHFLVRKRHLGRKASPSATTQCFITFLSIFCIRDEILAERPSVPASSGTTVIHVHALSLLWHPQLMYMSNTTAFSGWHLMLCSQAKHVHSCDVRSAAGAGSNFFQCGVGRLLQGSGLPAGGRWASRRRPAPYTIVLGCGMGQDRKMGVPRR